MLLSLISYILLAITLLLCLSCFARVLIQWSVRSSLAEIQHIGSPTGSFRSSTRFFTFLGSTLTQRWERPPPSYDEALKHVNPDTVRPANPPAYGDSIQGSVLVEPGSSSGSTSNSRPSRPLPTLPTAPQPQQPQQPQQQQQQRSSPYPGGTPPPDYDASPLSGSATAVMSPTHYELGSVASIQSPNQTSPSSSSAALLSTKATTSTTPASSPGYGQQPPGEQQATTTVRAEICY